ncbi:solute carrier family 23 member 3 isoform X1 [Falco biarmicus]|uniref:solute carrier family 23 member 3 isoform X1 n=2 Tax=Falco TaxID=8952 RepID=UPI000392ED0D|nr:solute carrier family 23 member 3 isoform X1 [Falco cherrug]XP_037252166.1 solute carrier family 23 member 3 isoform X1 [Falco rusticolus]XP_056204292.1 solute carrier family 23 member 3 isoform X1 [Falco biarmicus]
MNGGHCGAPGARSPVLASCSLQKMCFWMLSCCLALQHLAVQASLLCIFHLLLLPTLPEEPSHTQATGELLARSLFACGISTVLQTTLGSRLPLVQIPSFEYLIPAIVLSSHLSLGATVDRNGTAMVSMCPTPHCTVAGGRAASLQEVSGAVLVSGLVQLVLGVSGVCGWAAQHCGPMVLAPSLSIIGLSAYKEAAFFCSTNWGVALLFMVLAVTFSQHVGSCRLPFCAWPQAWGVCMGLSVPTLRMFSVLLPFAGVGTLCAILSHLHIPWESLDLDMAQLSWANSTFHAPWVRIPYAGEWGWPLLTPRALAVGIAMAISCSVNSVGCYVLCGRLLRAPQLPPYACNRGLCTEGLGSLLAGLLGTPGGTAASIANACATGLTQAGSRLSVQVSALVCVVLGMSPRLAGLLTRIPLAVHGGVLCVTYAVAVGMGISYFQYVDIDSGRNIFIVGFTMFMALLVPRWFSAAPAHLATGWVPLDLLFLSLLMVPVFLTGFLSFFLENTVSGTLEERGLLSELVLWKARTGSCHSNGERGEASQAYGLPAGLKRLLPSSCKAFPCCFLCLGSEEEEEKEEEEEGSRATEVGTAAPGEGTHLLPKPGSGEPQLARRLSEMEMPAWHTMA